MDSNWAITTNIMNFAINIFYIVFGTGLVIASALVVISPFIALFYYVKEKVQ